MNLLQKLAAGVLVLTAGSLMLATAAEAAENNNRCQFGSPLRVAIYQAGSYIDFYKVIRQTVLSLAADRYIRLQEPMPADFRFHEEQSYAWLAQASQGSCIEFLPDGLYDAKWDARQEQELALALKKRVREQGDVDLILALGTVGGQLLADSSLGVPVMVMTASDPESAGIVGPGEFSDKPNVHVQKEMNRTRNELTMFYNIFKFKRLGIIEDEDPDNWGGQSLPAVESTAAELGFELVRCRGPIISQEQEKAQEAYSRCLQELSTKADAVYLSLGNGASPDHFYSQLKPLIERKIPTFSQSGGSEVERGALLSLADMDLAESGAFEAGVVKQIYQGIPPEDISQYYYAPLALNLNLETARQIEWKPDFEILMALDQVFQTIKGQ